MYSYKEEAAIILAGDQHGDKPHDGENWRLEFQCKQTFTKLIIRKVDLEVSCSFSKMEKTAIHRRRVGDDKA